MSELHAAAEGPVQTSSAGTQAAASLRCVFRKQYSNKGQAFVLDVAFDAAPGFTILFGASGAGKTTVLDCIAGLATPSSGSIHLGGRMLFDSSFGVNVATAKRRAGYVLQSLALFPHMTVGQNVTYGLARFPGAERRKRVADLLSAFHISPLADRSVREISGGEGQRTALARTLVTDPEVLLLDEPLAALDAPTKAHIIEDLRAWNRTHHIPVIYVTHSREEVFALGDRVIVLEAGRILAQGTPHEVMSAPHQETVAELAGFENIFDAIVEAAHPERGTMVCRLSGSGNEGTIPPPVLETPLVRADVGSVLRIGIRAGDILLATSPPVGLSARNVIAGRITTVKQRDVIMSAQVSCGVEMEVHLTLAARDALQLAPGKDVWLVIKTHSCHLMQK